MVILLTLVKALRTKKAKPKKYPFQGLICLIYIFAVFGEIASFVYSGQVLQPVYIMGRTTLAFAMFYTSSRLIRTPADILLIMKAGAAGLAITSMLMVMSSLPMTRSFVANDIFSISFLEPAADNVVDKYLDRLDEEAGARGRSLVGVSILSGTFINIMWPLVLTLVYGNLQLNVLWRRIAMFSSFLAPVAVFMSYSRGPILGTILMLLCVLLLRYGKIRRGLMLPIILTTAIVVTVGVGSNLFFVERLVNRTVAAIDNPYDDERESERIKAYSEPFAHLLEHPQFLFIGEGNAINRTRALAEQDGMATHALFAKAYYSYGMFSAVLYMILVFSALRYAFNQRDRFGNGFVGLYAKALFLSSVAMLPWVMFGHAIVSQPRGTMIFFLILGLLASLRNFQVPFPYSPYPVYQGHIGVYGRPTPV